MAKTLTLSEMVTALESAKAAVDVAQQKLDSAEAAASAARVAYDAALATARTLQQQLRADIDSLLGTGRVRMGQ